jgi:hypothetical protein
MAKFSSTKRMKELINAESNVMDTVELQLYGVQAYHVDCESEYNVIIRAERHYNGRYYFVTREGYQVAWSILDKEQVEKICEDMLDQIAQDELETIKAVNRLQNNGTTFVRAEIMNAVFNLADEVNVPCHILTSGTDEQNNVLYHVSLGTTASEGQRIAKEQREKREQAQEAAESTEQAADHREPAEAENNSINNKSIGENNMYYQVKSQESKMAEFMVDNNIATDEEIQLVTNINGWKVETLLDILRVRTGYRSIEQALSSEPENYRDNYGYFTDEEDEEDEEQENI